MRQLLTVALVGPLLLPALSQDCDPGEPTPAPTPAPAFLELSASLEAERVALGAPGLAFAWFEGPDVRYRQGFGTRQPGREDPVFASSLFRIGSVNKMLTAAGVLQQVDQGFVDLDTPIGTYIPELEFSLDPTWDDTIHVRHVLDHTGGFYDYLEIDADPSDEALSTFINGYFAENLFLLAPPGRMWNYSNPNFYVAGLVTENVLGRYYRHITQQDLLGPLGMDRTLFLGEEVLDDGDYAAGMTPSWAAYGLAGPVVEADTYDNGWARPAGYAWSSVLDLARFGAFLMEGDNRVLSDAALAELTGEQVDTQMVGDLLHYGFGLFIHRGFFIGDDYYDVVLMEHGGAIPGYAAEVYVVPELGFGFASLASTDGAYLSSSLVLALELGGLPAPSTPPDLSPLPETFGDHVGHYDDPWNIVGPMDVSLVDGVLTASLPLLDRMRIPYEPVLEPYTPDNFVFVVQGYPLLMTFIRDEAGLTEYARTRLFVSTRTEAGAGGRGEPTAAAPTGRGRDLLLARIHAASADDGRVVALGPPEGRRVWDRARRTPSRP